MFKNLQKELEKLARTRAISVPVEADAEGYYDKECPAEDCLFSFKVHGEDWPKIPLERDVTCPSCGHTRHRDAWYPRAQMEAAKDYALGTVVNGLNKAIRADATASKMRPSARSFMSITLEAKGGRDAILLPLQAAEPMRLRAACEACGCRYSYVGAAYFCPSCGHNSARHTFAQTLGAIRKASEIGDDLRANFGADDAAVIGRLLLEKAIQDTVMSFQRLCEQLYQERTGQSPPRNAFQRLDSGSDLWTAQIETGYQGLVGAAKVNRLRVYYQQRHLLAHREGIIDQDYIDRSGDQAYVIGQRLIIREDGVREFADLIDELATALLARLQ